MKYLAQIIKRFSFVILGCFVLVGGSYLAYKFWRASQNQYDLVVYGNVDIRQVDLSFRVSGRIVKMVFEEGDKVKAGDVVAVLDKAPYEADFNEAKAEFEKAEANYALLQHGNRPQDIKKAYATVEERQAVSDNAGLTFKRQKEQIKVGSTSQQDYDTALTQKIEAEALLKDAKESLSLAEEGFRREDIQAGKATMEMAKAKLESAKLNLRDAEIIAPARGTILIRATESGTIVAPGSVVYTLSLLNPVWIRAYVSETNLGLLKPGMEALVFTDAHPDNPLKGQVGFISPQAEFTPKNVETPELRTDLVYRIRVVVDDPQGTLRQGMPVTLKIKIAN